MTAAAWVGGDLSGGQVAAVVGNVNDERAPLWAEHEGAVVSQLVPLPVHHVAAAMRVWGERADAVKLLPDATLQVTTPDGHVHQTRPPPRC